MWMSRECHLVEKGEGRREKREENGSGAEPNRVHPDRTDNTRQTSPSPKGR